MLTSIRRRSVRRVVTGVCAGFLALTLAACQYDVLPHSGDTGVQNANGYQVSVKKTCDDADPNFISIQLIMTNAPASAGGVVADIEVFFNPRSSIPNYTFEDVSPGSGEAQLGINSAQPSVVIQFRSAATGALLQSFSQNLPPC